MQYKLRRVLKHHVFTNPDKTVERHDIILSNNIIYLNEEQFKILKELSQSNEHNYIEYDNIIQLDRHPSVIEDKFDIKEFIEEYKIGINNEKFQVSFFYGIIE